MSAARRRGALVLESAGGGAGLRVNLVRTGYLGVVERGRQPRMGPYPPARAAFKSVATSEYTREFEPQLEAAREGSEPAWAAIYARLAPQVLGYLRASGAIEPEDTLSEVFLQVARDLPRFEGDERDFRAWAFTIAHHRLIDARRAAARRPADPVAEVPEPDTAPLDDAADEALARIGRDEILRVLARADARPAIGAAPAAARRADRRGGGVGALEAPRSGQGAAAPRARGRPA